MFFKIHFLLFVRQHEEDRKYSFIKKGKMTIGKVEMLMEEKKKRKKKAMFTENGKKKTFFYLKKKILRFFLYKNSQESYRYCTDTKANMTWQDQLDIKNTANVWDFTMSAYNYINQKLILFNWNHFEMRLLNLRINFLFIADFLSSSW